MILILGNWVEFVVFGVMVEPRLMDNGVHDWQDSIGEVIEVPLVPYYLWGFIQ